MSKLRELAMAFKKEKQLSEINKRNEQHKKAEDALAIIRLQFQKRFSEYLPMLNEEGIIYKAEFQDRRYFHRGSYIEFSFKGHILRMDFQTAYFYRFEYVKYQSSEGGSTMSFGEWPTERFPEFIYDGLLSKVEKDQALDKKEISLSPEAYEKLWRTLKEESGYRVTLDSTGESSQLLGQLMSRLEEMANYSETEDC